MFAVKVVGAALAIGMQIPLARILGTAEYGIYVYVFTWLNFLIIPAKLGYDLASLRFVAAYASTHSWGLFWGFMHRSMRIAIGGAIVVGVFVAFGILIARNRLTPSLFSAFVPLCILIVVSTYFQMQVAFVQALKLGVVSELAKEIVRRLAFAAAVLTLIFALHSPRTAALTMWAYVPATLVASLPLKRALSKATNAFERPPTRIFADKEWLSVALVLGLSGASYLVLNQLDIIMVGWLLGTKQAGIYGTAGRVAGLLIFPFASANAIAAPLIAGLHARGNHGELQKVVRDAARGVTAIALVGAIVLIGWRRWILGLFGHEFEAGGLALSLLVLSQILNASTGPVGNLLTMTGGHRVVAHVLLLAALANFILNLLLIPHFGIAGAAFATVVCTGMWNAVLTYVVWRRMRIRSLPF